MAGFRVSGTLTFTSQQRRSSALNRWSTQATRLGWIGTTKTQGVATIVFDYTKSPATAAEVELFAGASFRFCHPHLAVEGGWVSIEPLP